MSRPTPGGRATPRSRSCRAVAAIAASVIEHAQLAAEAARHRTAVEHLLRVSSDLTSSRSRAEMLRAVCEGIRDALGFELAGVFLDEAGDGRLLPVAGVGFDFVEGFGSFTAASVERMVAPDLGQEGCLLLDSETASALAAEAGMPTVYVSTQQRQRPASVEPPLADGAAARPCGCRARLPVGRRARRSPAARDRRAARPACVRQPRRRCDRGGPPGRAAARARRARPADRAPQPPRLRGWAGAPPRAACAR